MPLTVAMPEAKRLRYNFAYGTSWITPHATRAPALPAGCVA
jgi:hypothetical protein